MKRRIITLTIAVLFAAITAGSSLSAYNPEALYYQSQQVSTKGGAKGVQVVWANLNDPNIKVRNAIASNTLQTAAPLKDIAEAARPAAALELAAINAAFFDPVGAGYSGTNIYYGVIRNNGEYVKIGGNDLVMGISADNRVRMGKPLPRYKIYHETAGAYEVPSDMWALNHTFDNANERVIYTSYYGARTPANTKKAVVVRKGVVTDVVNGPAPIYADGFTIASLGANLKYSKGERVWYTIAYDDPDWEQYDTMVAGGPAIVEKGKIRTDYAEQGFDAAKITEYSAQRSFIGVTADNRLFIGTVGNATMLQLAEIALNMGAVNAMNLDGGASSSLYFGGKYVTSPGRNLVTAIVITYNDPKKPEPPPAPAPVLPPDAPSAWAASQVKRANELGLVPDHLNNLYKQQITRAEFCALATLLYEKIKGEEITERMEFSDTNDVHVEKMGALGIVNGLRDGRFEPDKKLTREHAAVILDRLSYEVGNRLKYYYPTYSDNDQIAGFAFGSVGRMQGSGLMGGVGGNNFDPKGRFSREQSIVTMLRLYDMCENEADE